MHACRPVVGDSQNQKIVFFRLPKCELWYRSVHCLQCVRQTYSTTACRHGSEYTAVCHRRLWTAVWPAAQKRPTRSHCHLHCTSTPPSDCTGNIQFTLMSRFGEMYRCVTCSPMDPVKTPILGTQMNLMFPRGTIISVTRLWRQLSVFVYAAAMFSVMCSYNTSKPEQYCMQLLYVMHAISDIYWLVICGRDVSAESSLLCQ